ncbi:MAG: hypothetical protein WCF65_08620 [Parachlamydiaceae bacterium]
MVHDVLHQNQQHFFHRNDPMYPQDKVLVIRPTHQYSGNITQTMEGVKSSAISSRTIDGALVVESVAEKVRVAAINYFDSSAQNVAVEQKTFESARSQGYVAIALGVTTGILGGVGLAASFLIPPLAISLIAFGVLATAVGANQSIKNQNILNGLQRNLSTLETEKKLWKDPVHHVIEQRQLCGSQGFSYVFNQRLKNTIVHPEEVRSLWIRDFSQMLLTHQTIDAFSRDLLGQTKLEYAWNSNPIPDLEIAHRRLPASLLNKMAIRYQECSIGFQQFSAKIYEETRALDNQAQRLNQEIGNQRSRWLLPAHHTYQQGVQEAFSLYNRALEPFIEERNAAIAEVHQAYRYVVVNPHDRDELAYKSNLDTLSSEVIARINREYTSHHAVRSIERAYERDQGMCTFLFNQSKRIVDSFFDQRVQQLDREIIQARQQIQEQRVGGESYFTNVLNYILQANEEQTLNLLQITAPDVHRQWRLSHLDLEPSWGDVYGRVPGFQSAFSDTITEAAWNLFWGNQGMRRFASSPTHTWSNLSSDRSHFPFRQQWFNLHTMPQGRQRGMFTQRVVVPPTSFRRPDPVRTPVLPTDGVPRVVPGVRTVRR